MVKQVTARAMPSVVTIMVCVLAAVFPSAVWAGDASVGTYGAPFLRIPAGARLIASPGVVAAMRPDASLFFANPAFVTGVPERQVFVSTSNWLDQMRFSAMSLVIPTDRSGYFSVGATLLYSSGLQGYDQTLNVVSEENYSDLAARAGYSYSFDNLGLSVGAGVAYIREHLYPVDGSGLSFSLGGSYTRGPNIYHIAFQDFGGTIDFDSHSYPIDPQTVLGAARVFSTPHGEVTAGGQVAFSDATGSKFQMGVDYRLSRFFTLRTGFEESSGSESSSMPFHAGFGVSYGVMNLEYAYSSWDYFSAHHTFSLVFGFSGGTAALHDNETPVISKSQVQSTPPPATALPATESEVQPPEKQWLLIGAVHGWIDNAEAEVRALAVMGVSATIEAHGRLFRVVIGRYATSGEAIEALARYRAQGHMFRVIED